MKNKRSAFTLVEIMIASAILSLLMVGVMSFYTFVLKGTYVTAQRQELSANIRSFSNEMVHNASRANQCILYLSSDPADYADSTKRLVIDTTSDPALHPAGDFVVFVYFEFPKPSGVAKHRIKLIRGYYITPGGSGIGQVKKVEIDLSAAPSQLTVEALLAAKWPQPPATMPSETHFYQFLLNVRGLTQSETATTNPRLFYKNDKRSMTVSGQIFQSNANILTQDWKTYTESFNFVVTTRS